MFAKYHALGNDYLVIDPRKTEFRPLPGNVRLVCARRLGVGSDGVLFGPVPGEGLRLRIFNPDGGEAEKSGNGVRIFAKYLKEEGDVPGGECVILTLGGAVRVEFSDADARLIKAEIGKPVFAGEIPAEDIPGGKEIQPRAVLNLSLGNPHCSLVCEKVSKELAVSFGPAIEKHGLFPAGTNVEFIENLGPGAFRLEIWERGAGYTLSSGTAACAAACALRKLGLSGRRVEAGMPGGTAVVETAPDGTVSLSGPVEAVCRGVFSPELRKKFET